MLFTTNGTKALCGVSAGVVVAGALTNVTAVAEFAVRYRTVSIVCAGNHGGTRFAMEDFAVAGALVALLHPGADRALNDQAKLAQACVATGTEGAFARAVQLMTESEHAAVTRDLGLGRDIDYACHPGLSSALPVVVAAGEGWVHLEDRRHLLGSAVVAALPS